MIKRSDKISEFPDQFNKLEQQVKSLNKNAQRINIAAWIASLSTVALVIVGVLALILGR